LLRRVSLATRAELASDSVRVKASESIEQRIEDEVAKAARILDHLDGGNLLDSEYLVSAVYSHDGFLNNYPAERKELDPHFPR
jgi:hypothetical protein